MVLDLLQDLKNMHCFPASDNESLDGELEITKPFKKEGKNKLVSLRPFLL